MKILGSTFMLHSTKVFDSLNSQEHNKDNNSNQFRLFNAYSINVTQHKKIKKKFFICFLNFWVIFVDCPSTIKGGFGWKQKKFLKRQNWLNQTGLDASLITTTIKPAKFVTKISPNLILFRLYYTNASEKGQNSRAVFVQAIISKLL